MGSIVVFGANGRVGRAVAAEARRRGHEVTAAGRADGDVTDAAAVARLAAGHDAVVAAVYDPGADPGVFFPAAARALADGTARAGAGRLVVAGLASVLPTADGTLLMDTPDYPQAYRAFYEGHAAGVDALRGPAGGGVDWLVLSPAGDFDHEGEAGGGYVVAPAAAEARITHADFAAALLDEVERPTHHGVHVGVTSTP
ncbi:NAD(P)-dependent oxidoreductase [Streptomyces sp. NPDC002073]|uniref:NAD(P)-dependent oxidoreductase n=1 Tax=Streptomyces sp. NBC_00239 TaxID=2903640 RepID=UPI002E2A4A4B|nr:NAD(P)H-binding protein [Streptomyces sp. NBC_00239]